MKSTVSFPNVRIPVLVTPAQKARITRKANEAGLPIGEFTRRAADSHLSAEDEELLEGMIRQLEKSTTRTIAAVDRALAIIDASNRRVDAMLAGKRPKATSRAAARKVA
jgi:mobilization protein NikA